MATSSKRRPTAAAKRSKTTKKRVTARARARPRPTPGTQRRSPPAATLARDLTKLQAAPASADSLAQVRDDIEQHGLETFFRALAQTPAGKQQAKARARRTREVARPLVAPAGDVGQVRQTWLNCIGSQAAQPLRLFRPATLAELRSIVQQAAAQKRKVKAVGSGHSFTDVATTTDFLIETHGLNRPLPLERDVLRNGVDTGTLFETEGGIVVRDLNEALWDAGLGLINMGGYDGQTIMGVVSTSTHGSGIAFGPLASFAQSLTMVASGGRVLRIEPQDGITDPVKWAAKHPDVELVQDDDFFRACQVGIGCLGVVYSLVMRVRERYWMKEERTLSTWRQVKQDLQDGRVLAENRHYEVLVNPYLTHGDHTCLVTRRNPVPEPAVPPEQLPHRNYLVEMFAKFPGSGAVAARSDQRSARPGADHHRRGDAEPGGRLRGPQLSGVQHRRGQRRTRLWERDRLSHGRAPGGDRAHFAAAADGQSVGKAYLTSPFSLRFVKASDAFLSMMHGQDTCMVEFPMLDGTIGGKELLRRIETEMYAFGGRPHWGLLNFLSGGALIESMYPEYGKWLSVYRQFNSDGIFDNAFTDRCGISKHAFVAN